MLCLVIVAVIMNVPLFKVRSTATESDGRDVAASVEVDIRFIDWWEPMVWLYMEESTVYIAGDFACQSWTSPSKRGNIKKRGRLKYIPK